MAKNFVKIFIDTTVSMFRLFVLSALALGILGASSLPALLVVKFVPEASTLFYPILIVAVGISISLLISFIRVSIDLFESIAD